MVVDNCRGLFERCAVCRKTSMPIAENTHNKNSAFRESLLELLRTLWPSGKASWKKRCDRWFDPGTEQGFGLNKAFGHCNEDWMTANCNWRNVQILRYVANLRITSQPSSIHTPTPILSNRVHARTARSEMSFWYADANKIYVEQNLDGPEKDRCGIGLDLCALT